MNNCRVLLADDEAAILEGYKLLFDWENISVRLQGRLWMVRRLWRKRVN